jgi:serine/threonine protein kinase
MAMSVDHLFEDAKNSGMKIEPAVRLRIMRDAARAVQCLHTPSDKVPGHMQAVVLHRDLKCGNLMLVPDWEKKLAAGNTEIIAKLGDFDCSRTMSGKSKGFSGGVGDLDYMPPEAEGHPDADKKDYDTSVDSYRFGCLLYEIWTLTAWTRSTPEDRKRITNQKLPPKEAGPDLKEVFSMRWTLEAPILLYDMANMCWDKTPALRPDFPTIVATLEKDMQLAIKQAAEIEAKASGAGDATMKDVSSSGTSTNSGKTDTSSDKGSTGQGSEQNS